MYKVTLLLHSWLRWAVLALLLLAIIQAYRGWFGNQPWTENHKRFNLFALIAVHTQLLLGLLLYFFGSTNWGKLLVTQTKVVMKTRALRFWAVEHLILMILAVVLFQLGYSRAKRMTDDIQRHKTNALYYTFALLAILAAIPWPFLKQIGRPWLRF